MSDILTKMSFDYYAGPQRMPEWYQLRIGKVTASRLEDWLSVSKAAKTAGQPLQKRKDYEKELQYERQFNVAYDNWVSDAMQDGVDFEDFIRKQYQAVTGTILNECGAWYNDHFVASPDRTIDGGGDGNYENGILEIKVVRDSTFSEILSNGVHPIIVHDKKTETDKVIEPKMNKFWKQVQGQLWASGKDFCDLAVGNLKTKKMKIIRIMPDPEFHQWLELAVPEEISVEPFSSDNLYDFVDEVPQGLLMEEEIKVKEGIQLSW